MKLKITLAFLLFSLLTYGQEINIVRAASIANNGSYAFVNTTSGTSTTVTFTIQNTLAASVLNLTGPPIVEIDGPDASQFTVNETGTLTTLTNVSNTTFTVTFSPTTSGSKSAFFTILSNDADESIYVINLTGIGTTNTTSAIIHSLSYSYTQNIPYQNYQAADINIGNSIEVGSFTLRDGTGTPDIDNLPTILTDLTFSLSNATNIRSVAIYDGLIEVAEEDGAASIVFNGLNLQAPDNGTKIFTIRVSYNDVVLDNIIPQFIITAATAATTGSTFTYTYAGTTNNTSSAARTSIATNDNRIEVTATKLGFVQDTNAVDTFLVMSPALTVEAVDALDNRDLDYITAVILTTTGTYSSSPAPVPTNGPNKNAIAGLATFPSIVHGLAGTGLTLTAASGSLTSTVSNSFDIGAASATNNYFRSFASGDWDNPASWQSSGDNVTWAAATLKPNTVSRGIKILNGHTISCKTSENGDQITVDAGGTLALDTGANFTLSNGATDLTVNGTFTYNNGTYLQATGAVIAVGATGVYNHAIASPTLTLPIATWNAAAVCNITGLNNATPIVAANMNQNFGILNWNNPNQIGYVAINNASFKVANILNIGTTTANTNNVLCLTDSGTFTNAIKTINISNGKLIAATGTGSSTMTITGVTTVSGGAFIGSEGSGTSTMNISGITNITGGNLIASTGSGTATLNTSTTFNISSGKFILIDSSSSGNVNFTLSSTTKDLTISGTGALLLENVSSATGVATLNLNRSFISTSTATPAVDFGTGTATDNAINIKGSLTKSGTGTFTTTSSNPAKGFVFNGTTQALSYAGATSSSVNYTVNSGAALTMSTGLTFGAVAGPASVFTVKTGGRINLGTAVITGNPTLAQFIAEAGSTLSSSSTGGLGGTAVAGSFQSFGSVDVTPLNGRLTLPAGVHYILAGSTTTPFPVGAGIVFGNPASISTSGNITSNMTSALTVTSAFTVSANTFKLNTANNNLILNNALLTVTGTFDNNGENQILNGGGSPSITINGRFITRDVQGFVGANTAIPTITPTLVTASTVEYAFAGNQAVQGSPAYRNLTVSGTGTKTLGSNASVATLLTVASPAIFDTQTFTAGGSGTALTMTGTAQYKTAGTGVKPDATGTYSLAAGTTTEFYGTQPLEIRLGTPAISYGKIIVNGTDVANNSTSTGIQFVSTAATFTVKNGAVFKLKNTDGFTGSTTTAISNSPLVNPILEANSTIEYAGGNQTITPYNINTTTSYKKLKISGTGIKTLVAAPVLVRENLMVTASLLKIESNKSLTVTNEINTVNTTATDGISIENNGSLVQVTVVDNATTNINVGNIDMQRITPPMYRYDFTYWSSPVKNYTMNALSPITLFDKYRYWDAASGAWASNNYGTEEMIAGKGYAIRAPQNFSTNPSLKTPFDGHFIGVPNNGNVTYATFGNGVATPEKFNLLGNPYPSAIDIEKFLTANSTKLQGTVYLWTHSTPLTSSQYNNNDYAVYNFSGPTTIYPLGSTGGATKYLAAGQGFFVKGISAGASTVTFTNLMRETNNNSNFFKSGPTTPVENWQTTGKHRVWLNLTNSQTGFNQLLVGYIQEATDGLDWGYDGEQFGGNQVTFYSLLDDKKLTIQGKALPFTDEDQVPLGYKTTLAGNLQISIDHYDGLFEGQAVYLEDQLLNIVHDLKATAYNFTSGIGTFDDRFILRYLPSEELGNPDHEAIANGLIVYKNNNTIVLKSQLEALQQVTVYDLLGRIVFDKTNIGQPELSIQNVVMQQQPLIVKVKLANGQVVDRKLVF